jgi:molybdopterin molybdotransferase
MPDDHYRDPRMRGFRSRTAVDEVIALIDGRVTPINGDENVDVRAAAGRVLARDVVAATDFPPFDRAAMDGYAVRGEETFGADAYAPATFRVIGASMPGRPFAGTVMPGSAIRIATGAPLPAGANAVVPVEMTETDGETVRVTAAVPPDRHVGRRGEDVAVGTTVLAAGSVLRPQALGVLSALGMAQIAVRPRPTVAILITGDELLPPGTPAQGCRIADMNSPMLAALIERDGGTAHVVGPLPDDRARLRETIAREAQACDAVLISGGSSTGPEDHAPSLVAELGELPTHGVALRPASPAGVGFIGATPVVLLPGNPVSCLCAYDLFAGRIIRRLGGRPAEWPYHSLVRPLARKLVSELGRVDYCRVRVVEERVEPLAVSGASILSGTTRADGFVLVPADLEGHPAGADVTVWLYDL